MNLRVILVVVLLLGRPLLMAQCNEGEVVTYSSATKTLVCKAPTSGGLPSGALVLIDSGTCPTGTTEETGLDGVTLIGTTAAHGDVGTTGGSDSLTPSGTVSQPTFVGDALATHTHSAGSFTAAAQAFTGAPTTVPAETVNSLTAAAQTVNSLTAAAQTVSSLTAAAQTFTGDSTTVPALGVGTLVTGGPSATIATGSSGAAKPTATHTHTITGSTATGTLTPLGHNATSAVTGTMNSSAVTGTMNSSAVTGTLNSTSLTPLGNNASSAVSGTSDATSAGTPSGTVSQPTFTGNSADNRSAFKKVIFCRAN